MGGQQGQGGLAALPPQICTLALGCNGLSGMLAHWVRLGGWYPSFLPLAFALTAAALACGYLAKLAAAPAAVWRDLGSPPTLSAVSTLPPVVQALAVRFGDFLPLLATQGIILVCHGSSLALGGRFLLLNYRLGAWPDPSWLPTLLLVGITNITVTAVGPAALRELVPLHFLAIAVVFVPLLTTVVYRILISKARDSVAPHAGMATLMAPCSFYTFCYLSTGKPFGDGPGLVLFALSTVLFFMTLRLLYVRRGLWIGAFHPTYVAFTFPVASTAAAAVLASERLPAVAGPLTRTWAAVLSVVAVAAVSAVLVRFLLLVRTAVMVANGTEKSPVAAKKQD